MATPFETGTVARSVLADCIAGGDLSNLEQLSPDVTIRTPLRTEPFSEHEGFREYARIVRRAFPDLQFAFDDIIADEDAAAIRWTAHATHDGELATLPATGRRVALRALELFRFDDEGRVCEIITELNPLEAFVQIGAVPAGEAKPPRPAIWFIKLQTALRGGLRRSAT